MIKCFSLLLIFLLSTFSMYGQKTADEDYASPLDISLVLASNFGELRPNHFHMGIDFKTQGVIGKNLYSVKEGFVSRIKVSTYGYGKVIYIDHPNGVTSVYGHCSEFKGKIDSLVRAQQIMEENFEVELFLTAEDIPVGKGELIALSGNTGGSTAPHLHFELRDTETEHALNPLVYGFDLADTKRPEIRGVKVYGLTKDGYRFKGKTRRKPTEYSSNGYYSLSEDEIIVPANFLSKSGGIGFAFDVIDKLDGANNRCGLYGSYLMVNGDTVFGQKIKRVPFESTRYVNSHEDYEEYGNNRKYHKSFRTRENNLPIYTTDDLGILHAKPNTAFKIKYVAYDSKGNTAVLKFNLIIRDGEISGADRIATDLTYLKPSESMQVEKGGTVVEFGTTTVYEPMKINDATIETTVGNAETPVHTAYRIIIPSDEQQDGKHYVEITTAKGRRRVLDIDYEKGHFVCESKYFGKYRIKRDTMAPSISPVGFSNSTTSLSSKRIQWKIGDAGAGLADYDLFIDGKWHLLEYEYKNRLVTFTRPSDLIGSKEVTVRVTDSCGNIKEWTSTIRFR